MLAGATGLTGGHLLEQLLAAPDFTRVYALSRRPLGREHSRLANRIVQFDRLEAQLKGLACHTAFCCLGASVRGAGSEQACRQVRIGYVVSFARVARAAQAERFVLLSCAGADPGARDAELRMASEAERAVEALGFPALDILQPGPLIGMRREMPLAERLRVATAVLAAPFMTGARESQRAIHARTVAAGMLGAARSGRRGTHRYTYAAIRGFAQAKPAARAQPVVTTAPRGGPPPA